MEVEAYGGPEDRASHARSGPTGRNAAMFGRPGCAYVYRVYGMHLCLNVVAGADGDASAILLRAVEPIVGVDAMRLARVIAAAAARRVPDAARDAADRVRIDALPAHLLASGPGRLGAAFSVEPAMDGADLCDEDGPLQLRRVAAGPGAPADSGRTGTVAAGMGMAADARIVIAGPRVGVGSAGTPWAALPWRFALAGSAAVSRPRPLLADPAAHPSAAPLTTAPLTATRADTRPRHPGTGGRA